MTPHNLIALAWIINFIAWSVAIVAAFTPLLYIAVPIIIGAIILFLSIAIYALYKVMKT